VDQKKHGQKIVIILKFIPYNTHSQVLSFDVDSNERLFIHVTGPELHGLFEGGVVVGKGVTATHKMTEKEASRVRKLTDEEAKKLVGTWDREVSSIPRFES